jgi:hypothetical protein
MLIGPPAKPWGAFYAAQNNRNGEWDGRRAMNPRPSPLVQDFGCVPSACGFWSFFCCSPCSWLDLNSGAS